MYKSLNLPRLKDLISLSDWINLISINNTTQLINNLLQNPGYDYTTIFTTTIYSFFQNTIPYGSKAILLTNQELLNNFLNNLINQILNYTLFYLPNLQVYFMNIQKINAMTNMISNQQTYSRNEKETKQNNNQNTKLEADSFNPISNPTNIEVPALQPANLGDLQGNQKFTTPLQSANFTTGTNATNFNENLNRNYTEFTAQQLQLLEQQSKNALIPILKKIGTLFWIMSDDFNTDEKALGFNIW